VILSPGVPRAISGNPRREEKTPPPFSASPIRTAYRFFGGAYPGGHPRAENLGGGASRAIMTAFKVSLKRETAQLVAGGQIGEAQKSGPQRYAHQPKRPNKTPCIHLQPDSPSKGTKQAKEPAKKPIKLQSCKRALRAAFFFLF
jgi:hypothetical protein